MPGVYCSCTCFILLFLYCEIQFCRYYTPQQVLLLYTKTRHLLWWFTFEFSFTCSINSSTLCEGWFWPSWQKNCVEITVSPMHDQLLWECDLSTCYLMYYLGCYEVSMKLNFTVLILLHFFISPTFSMSVWKHGCRSCVINRIPNKCWSVQRKVSEERDCIGNSELCLSFCRYWLCVCKLCDPHKYSSV